MFLLTKRDKHLKKKRNFLKSSAKNVFNFNSSHQSNRKYTLYSRVKKTLAKVDGICRT